MKKEIITLTIDGTRVETEKGSTILSAARKIGKSIPTLCFFEPLKPSATCRICVVEVRDGEKFKLVPSCSTPAESGMVVNTGSEAVLNSRRANLKARMKRCAQSERLLEMATDLGLEPEFGGNSRCILCGLCIQTCAELIGAKALSFEGQGATKKVATPVMGKGQTCITCGACGFVCPTSAIAFTVKGGKRIMWGKEFAMIACKECGKSYITEEFASAVMKRKNVPMDYFDVCDECRRKSTVATMSSLTAWEGGGVK